MEAISACGSLSDAAIGTLTGSAVYDVCGGDTISISANGLPSSTVDVQYVVQRELCGDGEALVQVLSVSGGLAGLELRLDNSSGAVKAGLKTSLGNNVQRFSRTQTNAPQTTNNLSALGHKWLKLARSGSTITTYVSSNGTSWNSGNAYCCNTLESLNVGMQVKGGCLSTDLVRGNTFGASGISLFLPVNDEDEPPYPPSIIGSQKHTKNRWLSGSGAARYEAEDEYAQARPFIVDVESANGNPAYEPSDFIPEDWFRFEIDLNGEDVCNTGVCLTLPFAPDSDDVKKLAAGDTLLATATYWDLQRYLYKNLQEYAVSDTTILAFLSQNDTSSVGAFYAVDQEITDLLYQDSAHQTSLATTLQAMESYLDSLVAADQLLPLSDSAQLAAWIVATNDWMNSLVVQSAYADSLASYIDGNLASGAVSIIALNDSIDAKTDFAYYEKTVNDLYLHRISGGALTSLDSSTIATLQDIAQQCPSVGGNAVLRARAWLTMAVSPAVVYSDSLACATSSARAALPQNEYSPRPVARQADQTYRLMPNPAQHEVTLAWTIPAEAVAPFELWDTYGRVVMEGVLPTGTTNHRINTTRLAPGIYFLRIKQVGADVATIKLLIQH